MSGLRNRRVLTSTRRVTPARRMAAAWLLAAAWVLAAGNTAAQQSPPAISLAQAPAAATSTTPPLTGLLQDPAQRERYQQLAEELRCLVCQNQTLADSGAELALDLRHQVESMIAAGHSNDEIKHFLVERYGDFVLYRPPMQRNTWVLWGAPFALLVIGAIAWWRVQRRPRSAASASGSDVERARRLLGE